MDALSAAALPQSWTDESSIQESEFELLHNENKKNDDLSKIGSR